LTVNESIVSANESTAHEMSRAHIEDQGRMKMAKAAAKKAVKKAPARKAAAKPAARKTAARKTTARKAAKR
jgi:DNA topoisomerase-1